jgi:hypothetical protein
MVGLVVGAIALMRALSVGARTTEVEAASIARAGRRA